MSRDVLERSTRRMRLVLLLLSSALLGTMVLVYLRSETVPYKMLQRKAPHHARITGIRTTVPCTGAPERCTTCHMNATRDDLRDTPAPRIFRPHGPGIGSHDGETLGCVVCHGGEGRALTPDTAHGMPGTTIPDPRRKQPHVQASCAQCHVPGAQKGQDRLLEGARLYAGLGCPVCHPLTPGGRGGMDEGPDLRTVGRRTIRELETGVLDPTADFEGSAMPSFKLALDPNPKAFESLIVYLESLALPRQSTCPAPAQTISDKTPCTHCHAGSQEKPAGRFTHRCSYLIERRADLRCAGCHKETIPDTGAVCPVIQRHLDGCAVCHRER